jgi:hypothetical protein
MPVQDCGAAASGCRQHVHALVKEINPERQERRMIIKLDGIATMRKIFLDSVTLLG